MDEPTCTFDPPDHIATDQVGVGLEGHPTYPTYSYRSASIGSRREALNAGHMPKKIPTDAEKPRPIANDHHGSEMGNPDSTWTVQPMPLPSAMPSTPPSEVRNAASMRN